MVFVVDGLQVGTGEVSVDLGGADVGMAEHHLDRAEIGPTLQ